VLLDVGCGEGSVVRDLVKTDQGVKLLHSYLIGLDIFLSYLSNAKKVFHDVIRCDIRFLPIKYNVADVVLATDVIEHIAKNDGLKLLNELERTAKRQLILMVPVGYCPKSMLEDQNPWQAHQSCWFPGEFKSKGFEVYGMNGFKSIYGERCEFKFGKFLTPGLGLLAVLTQFVTYKIVNVAHHMLCIKTKSKEL